MFNEKFMNALANAATAISEEPADPLMKRCNIPAEKTDLMFQTMFRSMAYFLKFKVKEAKESDSKQYGVYIKSLDRFIMGAYITIIDNDGESSVNLDFTFNEDDMKNIINSGNAVTVDDNAFVPYVSSSTNHIKQENGGITSFYVLPDYIHTVFVLAADNLKNFIEELLDDSSSDPTITLNGVFTATGFMDGDEKKVSITIDETIKQTIKSDDENEVNE